MPVKVLARVLAVLAPLSAHATDQRLSARIEAVRLDVSVQLDDSRANRLMASDFAVLDNGRPRVVSLVSTETMPINVVLLLDTSRSTAGDRQRELMAASEALLARLRAQDRAALLTFTDLTDARVPFTHDFARISDALRRAGSSGRTSLFDALVAGLSVASAASGRTLLLLCSDGFDNTSFVPASVVEDLVRGTGVVVYTVATGTGVSLERLAHLSGGASFRASSEEGLASAFARIIEDFRDRYLLSFPVDPGDAPGWHRLRVRLTKQRGMVRHRQGYWRPQADVHPAPASR